MPYETVIGLEIHVQLATATKLFCRCPNRFGAEPNTLICPVCLGYPGTLPVANRRAVDLAIRLSLALGAEVRPSSLFARKSYFYADLPKGYQISQFEQPLAEGGRLPLEASDRWVRIRRLHLEEDAGKLLHALPGGGALPGASLVDFNRCGVPLAEIVTEPDLRSPAEAQECLQTLHQVLLYTGTSDGNMEEASLRCDANVSIRPRGSTDLGTRTEVKNLNSFRHVRKALEHEAARQIRQADRGGEVVQETRSFDADAGVTRPLRGKEESHDYRYFPEPDLPTLVIAPERVARNALELPELPWARRRRFVADYRLPEDDARILTGSAELADFFERAAGAHPANPRGIANWLKTEVLRELKARNRSLAEAPAPERLAGLVAVIDEGRLSTSAAKQVLAEMWESAESATELAERLGLLQVRDEAQTSEWVRRVIDQNPRQVEQYRAGKHQLAGFFVGQVMRLSEGRAEPRTVHKLLRETLGGGGAA